MAEGYEVNCKKTSPITSEEITVWVEVYCAKYKDNSDMHQEFADKLHITRHDAKKLAHKIAYSCHQGLLNLGHGVGRAI
jgi:hypothetical protein